MSNHNKLGAIYKAISDCRWTGERAQQAEVLKCDCHLTKYLTTQLYKGRFYSGLQFVGLQSNKVVEEWWLKQH